MTKPSNFILNSDYLSIAQTGKNTFTAAFGGGTLTGYSDYTDSYTDFNISSEIGAIDRILIKRDSGNYSVCSTMRLEESWSGYEGIAGFVQVYRPSANIIRVRRVLENYSSGTKTYPAMTFTIKTCSFKPPNVF